MAKRKRKRGSKIKFWTSYAHGKGGGMRNPSRTLASVTRRARALVKGGHRSVGIYSVRVKRIIKRCKRVVVGGRRKIVCTNTRKRRK